MAAAYVREYTAAPSPAQLCQLFYVLSATAVLAIAAAPDMAQRLLTQYGARSSDSTRCDGSGSNVNNSSTDLFSRFVAVLTSTGRVPHSWFMHFYVLSLSCGLFWAIQLATHGVVLESIVKKQLLVSTSSMTMGQVALVSFLMGLQGARRLYEYLVVLRPSSSSMWVVHWLLGNGFYLCTSVSIWVEGSESIYSFDGTWVDPEFPFLKSIIASMAFLSAWIMQYRCHRYLAGLKKYSLPGNVVAAPRGQLYNQTLACAVLFVLVNLGITANGTKRWYAERFGGQAHGKWKMIPVVF
ncbi:hypothetical protein GGR50DRAFT_691952 [Xylaria sp. CBS 124048]|nr:hypothetical protein GGR50DRAFT_691952 [Xylaria sp. CBS 124048]